MIYEIILIQGRSGALLSISNEHFCQRNVHNFKQIISYYPLKFMLTCLVALYASSSACLWRLEYLVLK